MSAIDILIILVVVVAAFYGYRKGIIMQLGALVGIVAGIVACRLLGGKVAAIFIGENASTESIYISGVLAHVIIFIAVFIGVRIMARMVRSVSRTLSLTIVDRIAGVVFSVFEWMLALSILLNLWQVLRPGTDVAATSTLADGRIASFTVELAPKVLTSEKTHSIYDKIDAFGRDSQPQSDE